MASAAAQALTDEVMAEMWAFLAVDCPALPALDKDRTEWVEVGAYFGLAATVRVLQKHGLLDGGPEEGT